jgi:hypothetical protein
MATEPTKITIRMFVVGFGDCFLLTFHYEPPLMDQSILIDFGTASGGADMKGIAAKIKEACGGKLYAVVATHRHKDHISGFSDKSGKDSPGAIIASCKPEIVIQPWTEDPKAGADVTSAALLKNNRPAQAAQAYFSSLNAMQAYAQTIVDRAPLWRGPGKQVTRLEKLASNNTKNPDAVQNLRKMGSKPPRFLAYGDPSGLEDRKLLPGVKVNVLGPPTLEQANLRKYAGNSDEYWIACRYWALQQQGAEKGKFKLFPRAAAHRAIPTEMRWFVEHADAALKKNVLGIVRILDNYLNNTSLILLFEVAGKKLLFPGDAQLENWQWALSQKGIEELLHDVDVYKVGHHGSRNATPHKLWDFFDKRKGKKLRTLMSTAAGVYDKSEDGKVPSTNLVSALKSESDLETTLGRKATVVPIEVEVV